MTTSLSINLQFLEPYRLVEFGNTKDRKELRGRSFAYLNKKDGRAIITGTLLRSAVLKAAEEYLSITSGSVEFNGETKSCCNGKFETKDKEDSRLFRKRPTLKWSNEKEACGKCPFCNFLKTKDSNGNRIIRFGNLYLHGSGDLNKNNLKENASERILNRVDPRTGKAFDYFKVWEVEDEAFWNYKGKITINGGVDAHAIKLLNDSVRFIDRLCGALCVIDVDVKEDAPSPQPSPHKGKGDLENEDSPAINEITDKLSAIFIKTQKIEKLRSFADGIRALRLKDSTILSNLPRGKDNKHFLWDMDNGGKSIRKILEETVRDNASLKEKRNWVEFCNTLGNELYKKYKDSAGGFVIRERIIGDTPYYSEQAKAGDISWIRRQGDVKEWIFTGYLKAETPFFFGTEAKGGDQTSIQILLDKKSRQYRIPRSVLRGILRNDLRLSFGTGCSVELGGKRPCDCLVCIVMRKITIMDAKSDFREPPELRHRIRQNPYTGTVDEGALFDIEVGPEGVKFPFVMRYRGEGDKPPKELTNVLHLWKDVVWFGGSGSTGKGRFSLQDLRVFKWDFSGEGLKSYIENRGLRKGLIEEKSKTIAEILNNNYKGLTEDKLQSKSPDFNPWTKVEYEIHIKSPLLSADPIEALFDLRNADSVVYKKRIIKEGNVCDLDPVYKGESIRGLIRTAFGKNLRKDGKGLLEIEHEDCNCELCKVFGNEHEAGKIRFEDLSIVNPVEKKMDHVAIDRFTSGAADKKKFDDYPIQGNSDNPIKLKGKFWVRSSLSDYENIIKALSDIRDGLYPLGGKTGIGYGWVKDLIVTSPSNLVLPAKTEPTEANISEASSPFNGVKPCDRKLESNKVYSPHYFLKPHETVKRESELIGHEKFRNDKLTGKIVCKLKNKTPLIIPDTEKENAFDLQKAHPKHKNFKFFRINDKEMIPGSEIRGAIGTIYEALTNSCFRVMEEKRYLTRRIKPETDIKQGIVGKDKDTGKFKIEEVIEVYRLPFYENKKITDDISEKNETKMTEDYKLKSAIEWNNKVAEIADKNRTFINSKKEEKMEILAGRKEVCFKLWGSNPNDRIVCLCENDGSSEIKKGYIKFTGLNMVLKGKGHCSNPFPTVKDVRTLEIIHNDSMGRKPPKSERKYPRPILQFEKDNYKYTIPKRCERVFVTPKDGVEYEVSEDVINRYRDVLQDYANNYGRFDERFITTAVIDHKELKEGDLVYFLANGNKVEAIMPVPISRVGDTDPLGNMLPYNTLRPCEREILEDINMTSLANLPEKYLFRRHEKGLCPACRLFGTTGYKGRVRFGFAELQGEPKWLMGEENGGGKPLTLPLLEKPRPTWSMPDDKAKVPGRKFYVHHNGWEKVKSKNSSEPKTENNRTVEPLAEGNEFTFEVFFENLEEWELGLLLYSLELEDDMAHKIGMGKALGFGSVGINVEKILLKNSPEKTKNNKSYYLQQGFNQLKEWFVEKEKPASEAYGFEKLGNLIKKDWYNGEHIKELRCLLKFQENKNIEVRYPKLRQEDDKEKQYPGYEELKNGSRDYLTKPWEPWHTITRSHAEHRNEEGNHSISTAENSRSSEREKPAEKYKGKVKWFNESRGFGFITQDNGEDVFVHHSAIIGKGFRTLKEGQMVKFNIKQGDKGLQACDVETSE